MAKRERERQKSLISRLLLLILRLHIWFWCVILVFCILYNFINPPITPLMLHRYFIRGYDWHKRYYLPLERYPNRMVKMVMYLEDPNFYRHWGFEWQSIQTAWKKNKRAGRIRFGASTISNQLARTLFLTTHRNYFRKYIEMQITIIMEVVMSKKRMLELYLNYIESGKGLYGIETASRFYYGRSVTQISTEEAMKLVCILTNPIKYTPQNFYRSRSAMQRYHILIQIY